MLSLPPETALVAVTLFCSTLIRSAFGFGDALVAMPVLALCVGLQMATPLVALVALTLAALITIGSWREVQLDAVGPLLGATLVGVPLGMWGLKRVDESLLQSVLGAVLVAFAVFRLRRGAPPWQVGRRAAYGFGLAAGMLGGAYNTNGPPVVVYAALRGWSPTQFRATLQSYFLVSGAFITLGHGLAGLWTRPVLGLYLACLPVVLFALALGRRVHQRLPAGRFEHAVSVLLLALGALLLWRSFGV